MSFFLSVFLCSAFFFLFFFAIHSYAAIFFISVASDYSILHATATAWTAAAMGTPWCVRVGDTRRLSPVSFAIVVAWLLGSVLLAQGVSVELVVE